MSSELETRRENIRRGRRISSRADVSEILNHTPSTSVRVIHSAIVDHELIGSFRARVPSRCDNHINAYIHRYDVSSDFSFTNHTTQDTQIERLESIRDMLEEDLLRYLSLETNLEKASWSIEVVDPARERLTPRGAHNRWPHDNARDIRGLFEYERLGDRFCVNIGIRARVNDLLREVVEVGVVEEVHGFDGSLWRHRWVDDFFGDELLIAVGERCAYVNKHLDF